MKKTNVWLALLAFCGTNTPVAAGESSQESMRETVSINEKYWTADHATKTITSNEIFQMGNLFSSNELKEIFNDLGSFLNASNNSNEKIDENYKIDLGELFLSNLAGETIDFSPIAEHIHRIGKCFLG